MMTNNLLLQGAMEFDMIKLEEGLSQTDVNFTDEVRSELMHVF